ncbi:hypothetical protein SSS_07658 [Sarcoptes scabiei]|uniref:Uncharacterized protein n=1 Tax=Sarcoptes scabiei TaxID=52283 RepID=A0A834V949_SARSC|nr:hypothetical protein SSS_07658 [Sarcoptes scabiei]
MNEINQNGTSATNEINQVDVQQQLHHQKNQDHLDHCPDKDKHDQNGRMEHTAQQFVEDYLRDQFTKSIEERLSVFEEETLDLKIESKYDNIVEDCAPKDENDFNKLDCNLSRPKKMDISDEKLTPTKMKQMKDFPRLDSVVETDEIDPSSNGNDDENDKNDVVEDDQFVDAKPIIETEAEIETVPPIQSRT